MTPPPASRSIRLLLASAAVLGLAGSAIALARAGEGGSPHSSARPPSQAQVWRDDPGDDVSASPTSTTSRAVASRVASSTTTARSGVPAPTSTSLPAPAPAPVPPPDPAPAPELTPALFPVPPVEWVPAPPVECVPVPPTECATSALVARLAG